MSIVSYCVLARLMYWVVFGVFHILEKATDVLLFWVKWYYPLKLLFLIWCFLPFTNGSTTVYNIIVRPFFRRHQERIDTSLAKAHESALQATGEIGRVSTDLFGQAARNVARNMFVQQLDASASPSASSAAGSASPAASSDNKKDK
eukprot:TRINITY_DN61096_c0_g1_i2.p2 TRINITY_DN61096_c0_g1~~TRINITY_DN61096_c0_g1_i2.p2  ORF type:complete len:146 (-),score=59.53 TRINITY_DN61096_c0_g1_i2:523-960(-)